MALGYTAVRWGLAGAVGAVGLPWMGVPPLIVVAAYVCDRVMLRDLDARWNLLEFVVSRYLVQPSSVAPPTTPQGRPNLPLEKLEASGQHEVLNWLCLAGAAAELGHKMHLVDWVETWIFNAPKCLAVFR